MTIEAAPTPRPDSPRADRFAAGAARSSTPFDQILAAFGAERGVGTTPAEAGQLPAGPRRAEPARKTVAAAAAPVERGRASLQDGMDQPARPADAVAEDAQRPERAPREPRPDASSSAATPPAPAPAPQGESLPGPPASRTVSERPDSSREAGEATTPRAADAAAARWSVAADTRLAVAADTRLAVAADTRLAAAADTRHAAAADTPHAAAADTRHAVAETARQAADTARRGRGADPRALAGIDGERTAGSTAQLQSAQLQSAQLQVGQPQVAQLQPAQAQPVASLSGAVQPPRTPPAQAGIEPSPLSPPLSRGGLPVSIAAPPSQSSLARVATRIDTIGRHAAAELAHRSEQSPRDPTPGKRTGASRPGDELRSTAAPAGDARPPHDRAAADPLVQTSAVAQSAQAAPERTIQTDTAPRGEPNAGPGGLAPALAPRADAVGDAGGAGPVRSYPITVPVQDTRFPDALSERVTWLVREGLLSAELTVEPRDLGPIRIELSLSGDAASIGFVVGQADTRGAIEQALPRLREMLAGHGLQLGGAQIDAGRGGSDGGPPQRREGRDGTRTPIGEPVGTSAATPPVVGAHPAQGGRVDVFA